MRKFKIIKVHDLAMSDGSNPKRVCKCINCENLKNRMISIYKPWYKRIFKKI